MNASQRTATRKALQALSDEQLNRQIDNLIDFIAVQHRRIGFIRKSKAMSKGRKVARIEQLQRWIDMREERLSMADTEWLRRNPEVAEERAARAEEMYFRSAY